MGAAGLKFPTEKKYPPTSTFMVNVPHYHGTRENTADCHNNPYLHFKNIINDITPVRQKVFCVISPLIAFRQ